MLGKYEPQSEKTYLLYNDDSNQPAQKDDQRMDVQPFCFFWANSTDGKFILIFQENMQGLKFRSSPPHNHTLTSFKYSRYRYAKYDPLASLTLT